MPTLCRWDWAPLAVNRWAPPAMNDHALHIAGIETNSGASVGGVLRNHLEFLGAFSGPLGLGFGRVMDVHALLRGWEPAEALRSYVLEVWTQSSFLVDNIALPSPLWDCERSWSTI